MDEIDLFSASVSKPFAPTSPRASCCVAGCAAPSASLYRPPAAQHLRCRWMDFIYRGDVVPKKRGKAPLYVCGNHFPPDSFANLGAYRAGLADTLFLKVGSVPSRLGDLAADLAEPQTAPVAADSHSNARTSARQSKRVHHVDCQTEPLTCTMGTQLSWDALPPRFKSRATQKSTNDGAGNSTDAFRVSMPLQQTGPDEENCPEITIEVSEFIFATDDENDSNEDVGVADEESHCSDEEEEEEEEEEVDSDSDWEKDSSDQLESDSSEEWASEIESELPKGVLLLCPECGAFFSSCKTHKCEYKIKPFSCNICGKRCMDQRALRTHSKIHEESYEHQCKFCMAPFKTRLVKLAHEKTHKCSAKPYKCPDCSMTFSTFSKRNLHLKGHRGSKTFSCPHCALEFPRVSYLQRHMVVHTGMKKFGCTFCSRSFNQAGHLKSHMRLHTGEKPFQCQHCDKSFNHNVSLKSHVVRYHKGTSDRGPTRRKQQIKKINYLSSGRPIGRPKRNAATGETNSIPAGQAETLEPITAADASEEGHLRGTSSKDI